MVWDTDTQVLADSKTTSALTDSIDSVKVLCWFGLSNPLQRSFSFLLFPLFFQQAMSSKPPPPAASIIEKASSRVCALKPAGRNLCQSLLFIHFDLEVQMFPTQRQLSCTYIRGSCEAHDYTYDESQR